MFQRELSKTSTHYIHANLNVKKSSALFVLFIVFGTVVLPDLKPHGYQWCLKGIWRRIHRMKSTFLRDTNAFSRFRFRKKSNKGNPKWYFTYRGISVRGISSDTSHTMEYPIAESKVTRYVAWNMRYWKVTYHGVSGTELPLYLQYHGNSFKNNTGWE